MPASERSSKNTRATFGATSAYFEKPCQTPGTGPVTRRTRLLRHVPRLAPSLGGGCDGAASGLLDSGPLRHLRPRLSAPLWESAPPRSTACRHLGRSPYTRLSRSALPC